MRIKLIGIVAPAARLDPVLAERAILLASEMENGPHLLVHPQCHLSDGHFAGDDEARARAFLDVANDPHFDAVWIARGGYGCCRIAEQVLDQLNGYAREKIYLGYSDAGALMAGLYGAGFSSLAHGPMPQDIVRAGGEAAVTRALGWLVARDRAALEPSVTGDAPTAAFNIAILASLIGTPLQPDLSDHVLMLEEVSEHMYRIDRMLFQITSNPEVRKVAGIRLGRCGDVPENDPPFGMDEEQMMRDWCRRSGIPYLGRADIGHDAENKVVPFGRLSDV